MQRFSETSVAKTGTIQVQEPRTSNPPLREVCTENDRRKVFVPFLFNGIDKLIIFKSYYRNAITEIIQSVKWIIEDTNIWLKRNTTATDSEYLMRLTYLGKLCYPFLKEAVEHSVSDICKEMSELSVEYAKGVHELETNRHKEQGLEGMYQNLMSVNSLFIHENSKLSDNSFFIRQKIQS